jgi:hypothetical protein
MPIVSKSKSPPHPYGPFIVTTYSTAPSCFPESHRFDPGSLRQATYRGRDRYSDHGSPADVQRQRSTVEQASDWIAWSLQAMVQARPAPVFCTPDQPRPQGVTLYVTQQGELMIVLLNWEGFEAVLVDVPRTAAVIMGLPALAVRVRQPTQNHLVAVLITI